MIQLYIHTTTFWADLSPAWIIRPESPQTGMNEYVRAENATEIAVKEIKYDSAKLLNLLGRIRMKQGTILGRMYSIGFDYQEETVLSTLSMELVHSSEIEGEQLNVSEVRSSIARKLGIEKAGLVPSSRYVVCTCQVNMRHLLSLPVALVEYIG